MKRQHPLTPAQLEEFAATGKMPKGAARKLPKTKGPCPRCSGILEPILNAIVDALFAMADAERRLELFVYSDAFEEFKAGYHAKKSKRQRG